MSKRRGTYIGFYTKVCEANNWAKGFVGVTKIKTNDALSNMSESLGRVMFGMEQREKPRETIWDNLSKKDRIEYYEKNK